MKKIVLLALVCLVVSIGNVWALELGDPNWRDGEKTTYNWVNRQTGWVLGKSTYLVRKINISGIKAYRITADTAIGNTIDKATFTLKAVDLKPISCHKILTTAQGSFDINANYKANLVNIVAQTPGGQKSLNLRIPQDSYDNEEVLFMLRGLPLALNYRASFTNIVIAAGAQVKSTVRVVGSEVVKTQAGTFQCHKVELSFVGAPQKHYIWYSKDKTHYMVKYDNGQVIAELARIE